MPSGEQIWLQQISDHARVMQGATVTAVFRHVKAFKEIGPIGSGITDRAAKGANDGNSGFGCQHFMRHIQRHHNKINTRSEHNISGLRIDINVELCHGRDIATFKIAPPHQHNLLNAGNDVWRFLEGQCDIGQRPQGAKGDSLHRFTPHGFNDEIHGVQALQCHCGVHHHRPVQPGLAMHMFRRHQFAHQRAVGTCKHGHIAPPRQFANNPGVAGGQRQRHIACNTSDAQNVNLIGAGKG